MTFETFLAVEITSSLKLERVKTMPIGGRPRVNFPFEFWFLQ
jgi:hypothetical protein